MNSNSWKLFVDGKFCDAARGGRTALVNPATEETFAEVASADAAEVDAAAQSAHRAWEGGWRDLAPGKRGTILFNVARVLRENIEAIAQLEMQQMGKPISDARDEAGWGGECLNITPGLSRSSAGRRSRWREGALILSFANQWA